MGDTPFPECPTVYDQSVRTSCCNCKDEFNLGWLKTAAEKEAFQSTVTDFYNLAKQIDPKRIIMLNDGLLLRPSDMFSLYSGAPADGPTVRHEFGEYYCSLPDPGLID